MCNQEKHIKHVLKVCLVLTISLVLMNEPPKRTNASELNKQDQPEIVIQQVNAVVEPQPEQKKVEAKVEKPKPKPKTYPKGCENYVAVVRKYFGAKTDVALKVAKAESGCNPMAIGDNYPIRGLHAPSCGLFQIRTLAGRPSCSQLQNPETNVSWAYRLYKASGWQPWTVCNHGIVYCY